MLAMPVSIFYICEHSSRLGYPSFLFQREKARLYDEYIKYIEKCNKRCSTYPHYCDYEYHQLLYDEYLEKIYEPKVKGKALSKTKKKHSIK